MDSILKQQAERKVLRPSESKFAPASREQYRGMRQSDKTAAFADCAF